MHAPYAALAEYNRWMNEKVFAAAAELTAEERDRDLGAFFGSLSGTLGHVLLADRIWLGRFTGDTERFASRDGAGAKIAVRTLDQRLYTAFEDLRRERAKTDADIEAWAAKVEPSQLDEPLRFASLAGAKMESPLWVVVTHFFNHQTHHRGQATALLHQLGKDPGVTDFFAMMRSHR